MTEQSTKKHRFPVTFGSLTKASVDDLTSSRFWRGALAEFLGTLLLVFIGCGACISAVDWQRFHPSVVQIAFAFGLTVAICVWCLSHVAGGGHINPAITFAMFVTGKISVARVIIFIIFQCGGAIAGAGILYGLTPPSVRRSLGSTSIGSNIGVYQALGVELVITFILVMTVFASCDPNRTDLRGSAALFIGISVTACHLFAIRFTGSSMNPARSLGPAVVICQWQDHWIYWVGPIIGGSLAGVMYELLFAVDASANKFCWWTCCCCSPPLETLYDYGYNLKTPVVQFSSRPDPAAPRSPQSSPPLPNIAFTDLNELSAAQPVVGTMPSNPTAFNNSASPQLVVVPDVPSDRSAVFSELDVSLVSSLPMNDHGQETPPLSKTNAKGTSNERVPKPDSVSSMPRSDPPASSTPGHSHTSAVLSSDSLRAGSHSPELHRMKRRPP